MNVRRESRVVGFYIAGRRGLMFLVIFGEPRGKLVREPAWEQGHRRFIGASCNSCEAIRDACAMVRRGLESTGGETRRQDVRGEDGKTHVQTIYVNKTFAMLLHSR